MILDVWNTIVRDIMYGSSTDVPHSVAMGDGTASVTVADTGLANELFRKTIDSRSKPGTDKFMFQGTLSSAEGNSQTFTEVGGVNSAGVFVNRQVHTGILKASTFELRYQIEIEFKDA